VRFNLDTDKSGTLFTFGCILRTPPSEVRDNWLESCIPSSLIMSGVQGRWEKCIPSSVSSWNWL